MSMLIGEVLDRGQRSTPHAIAATLDGQARTFTELDLGACHMVTSLRALGLRRSDLVTWWSDASLHTLEGFIATARLGCIFTPLNPRLSRDDLDQTLRFLEPQAIVVDAAHLERALDLATGLGIAVAVFDPATAAGPPALCLVEARSAQAGGRAVQLNGPEHANQVPHEDDPHIAYLTSGSTGRPKAVLVSHRASWLRSAPGGGTFAAPVRGNGGIVCTFPLYHYGGWHYVLEAWLNMTAVHLVARAEPDQILAAVQRWHASALYCIPAVWERLLDESYASVDMSSLNHCDTGTSPVTRDLVTRIKARIPNATTTVLYGSTEAGRMAALQDWDHDRHAGSVGKPAFPCSLWIDEAGEVCVRSDAVMIGYLNDPKGTAAVLHDQVYRSGDLGWVDNEGYLYLVGRTREVIRTGGEFVAPVEVERAIASHSGVADVAVIGVPDERWGEIVCAVVVPLPGAHLDLGILRAHVADKLTPHKHPRRLEIVANIPRTPATGQIQRSALRRQIIGGHAKV